MTGMTREDEMTGMNGNNKGLLGITGMSKNDYG